LVSVDDADLGRGGDGLAGEDPPLLDLVVGQRVVDVHANRALDEPGHARGAAAGLARVGRRQPELARRLEDGGAGAVVGGPAPAVELDRHPRRARGTVATAVAVLTVELRGGGRREAPDVE